MKDYFSFLGSVIGILLLLVSTYLTQARQEFLYMAERVPGIVVGLNAGGAHPQIEFAGPEGKTFSYPQGGMIYGYRIGQPVEVLYLREAPRMTAVINDRGAVWGMPALIALIGLVAGTASVFAFYNRRKKIIVSHPDRP